MKVGIIISIVWIIAFTSCNSADQKITNAADYEQFLKIDKQSSLKSILLINADINFWLKKMQETSGSNFVAQSQLGNLFAARFKAVGDIDDIHRSDSFYHLANQLVRTSSSSVYRALAANSITQHRFKKALLYLDSALILGDNKLQTMLMLCDVSLELGNIREAKIWLSKITDKTKFYYLLRESKIFDHEGKTDQAIKSLQKGMDEVLASNNKTIFCWAMTNLGDMYGHASRLKQAYQCYLEALQKDPEDTYALKGIAWLAFSHDYNTTEAKRILQYLRKVRPVPDYNLVLAEIAAYENDLSTQKKLVDEYVNVISDSRYGEMYNKYHFYLMIDEKQDMDAALDIALKEVQNRPTPGSYDLLAWANHKLGKSKEAFRIAKDKVENKSFEPETLYHLGVIYGESGQKKKAKHYLNEARRSAFELGPGLSRQIEIALKRA